jgi:hypothetical protein
MNDDTYSVASSKLTVMDSDAMSCSQYSQYSRATRRSDLDKGAYFGKQFRDVVRNTIKAKTRPSSARNENDTRVMRNDYTKNMSSSIHYPGASITPVKTQIKSQLMFRLE